MSGSQHCRVACQLLSQKTDVLEIGETLPSSQGLYNAILHPLGSGRCGRANAETMAAVVGVINTRCT